ncbi:unnamed protein product [Mytilus coruscus]|uniref:SWIM-type domain-containing protein n=1 Tax=Mytilus coruscus TaxID=42192 RepID=A0A6J8DEK7_MYTCO|nr:unnamed protein product [Mytilus coruscus]
MKRKRKDESGPDFGYLTAQIREEEFVRDWNMWGEIGLDGLFSSNRVESIHDNLKDWITRTEKIYYAVLNVKVEEHVKVQMQEFELSGNGYGSYDLSSEFGHLRQERHIWNGLSQTERKKALDEFRMSKPKQIRFSNETDAAEENYTPGLTIRYDKKTIFSGVGKDFLKELWSRADALIRSITTTSKGRVVCNDCPVYNNVKICSHAVAGADFLGVLAKYIAWRSKEIVANALSDIIFEGARGGKKKISKPRRGGRAPVAATSVREETSVHRPPLRVSVGDFRLLQLLSQTLV